ncbi:MAG: exodeoxyribonuclease VII large subunit [Rickettsiales bacterium]|nr:exodeoxyribonuclease VII large subunit [Rickettsiales bacterium]
MIDPSAIFSVSEISLLIKGSLETAFNNVRLRGELSQITRAASGHTYMTIKDADAAISAIIWRGTPLPLKLENGLEIIATGRVTTYPARSNYQLIVSNVEMAGTGAILKMLEDRKRKLAAEGLFDAARKLPLPAFPRTIGVITSPTGAAVHDIISRLKTRIPTRVLIWPATVQGETAAASVVAGIEYFNKINSPLAGEDGQRNHAGRHDFPSEQNPQIFDLVDSLSSAPPAQVGGQIPRPDILIVARGGGSLEDLLPFSEESVVRAVAASKIPIVSGVGHEPDFMLIDFAASVRAPTPTAAAQIAVPELAETISRIESFRLANPRQMLAEKFQRLDDLSKIMSAAFLGKISYLRQRILGLHVQPPEILVSNAKNRIKDFSLRLNLSAAFRIDNWKRALAAKSELLESLSHMKTLRRGFAIVKIGGKIVSSKNEFGTPAEIVFGDGSVEIK